MKRTTALICVCFCAGLVAAMASSAFAWLCSQSGLIELAGVTLQADFDITSLYPRLVWGGIWGLAYSLTVAHVRNRKHWVRKGLLISILPALYQLLIVYPYHTAHGTLGIDLGVMNPFFVILFSLVWGIFTGVFTRLLWGKA